MSVHIGICVAQLLAALWLLRALGERCTLRFAGRLALAQGLRFLGPTGALGSSMSLLGYPGVKLLVFAA